MLQAVFLKNNLPLWGLSMTGVSLCLNGIMGLQAKKKIASRGVAACITTIAVESIVTRVSVKGYTPPTTDILHFPPLVLAACVLQRCVAQVIGDALSNEPKKKETNKTVELKIDSGKEEEAPVCKSLVSRIWDEVKLSVEKSSRVSMASGIALCFLGAGVVYRLGKTDGVYASLAALTKVVMGCAMLYLLQPPGNSKKLRS